VLERIGLKVVGKTTSGSDATSLVEEQSPDLLILEVDALPGEPSGLEVLRHARSRRERLRAVVLTTRAGPEHIDAALNAGASAYVLKSAHPDDLATALRQTFDHSVFTVSPRVAAQAEAPSGRTEGPAGLTRRELEILKLVAEGHSNTVRARTLWVTEQTVKFHLSNIYRKLDVTNRTQASRWAQLNGLLEADE
jgi:DNA-binding NarL/FixJ family response regulator